MNRLLLVEFTWEIVIDHTKVVCYVTEVDGRFHCGKTHITDPHPRHIGAKAKREIRNQAADKAVALTKQVKHGLYNPETL